MRVIKIAEEFTDTPGPRFRFEGEFSGEEFRETLLEPAYLQAKADGSKIRVDFDGAEGYATSFIEEAFGGLRRLYPQDDILSVIGVKSDDEVILINEVSKCVAEALEKE